MDSIFIWVVLFLILAFFLSPLFMLFQILWGLVKLAFHTVRVAIKGLFATAKYFSKQTQPKQPPAEPPPPQVSNEQA